MTSLSVRGLDDKVVARLKKRARAEGKSVNGLVVGLLSGETGISPKPSAPKRFDDLDALFGTWTTAQAEAFERVTAPFREVDPELWK